MADFKEVTIKLTDDQRNQIKSAIGQDISEVKVSADRGNPLERTRRLVQTCSRIEPTQPR